MSLATFHYDGSKDEVKPSVNTEQLRIYSHPVCPFVQRAFLALGWKEIPFQKVFVELRQKAKWHMDLNGGLVPILETP